MSPITTHILDTARGRPAQCNVKLQRVTDAGPSDVGQVKLTTTGAKR